MRKTSFGLGLAATIISFVLSLVLLLVGTIMSAVNRNIDWDSAAEEFNDLEITIEDDDLHFSTQGDYDSIDIDLSDDSERIGIVGGSAFPNVILGVFSAWFFVSAICLFAAAVLGIIGIVITKKRRSVAAGVMLLVASVLSIPSLYGLHATALFIPAGILAFLKDRRQEAASLPPQEGAV